MNTLINVLKTTTVLACQGALSAAAGYVTTELIDNHILLDESNLTTEEEKAEVKADFESKKHMLKLGLIIGESMIIGAASGHILDKIGQKAAADKAAKEQSTEANDSKFKLGLKTYTVNL